MQPSNKRKVLLINPKFQITFMAYTLAITLLVLAANYAAIEFFFVKFGGLGSSIGLASDHPFFKFLREQHTFMITVYLVTALVSFLLLIVGGLYLSHRVAGPLYRLHRHMNSVAEGKTQNNVSFRKGDFFPELADAYNKQLERIKK